MRVIIAGGRDFDDYEMLSDAMARLYEGLDPEIVSGGAQGADALGERLAEENNCKVRRFPAEWKRFGKTAGPRRNAKMASYADALVAFWDGKSPGTKNMIAQALDRGLEIHVFRYGSP